MKGVFDKKRYASDLGLTPSQAKNFECVRKAFRKQIQLAKIDRFHRIKVNRAYSQICAKLFNSTLSQLQILIINGDSTRLQALLLKDTSKLNAKVNQYPLIYLAVRSGHYDIVELLLKHGCSLCFSGQMSTPMHCAAFYGLQYLIPLLFMYGVPIDIKNKFESLPIQEAATPQITKLLTIGKQNKIHQLNQKLLKHQIGYSMLNISSNNEIVVKKLVLRKYFNQFAQFDNAFHGTSYEKLFSIAKYGLLPPGSQIQGETIDIVPGHIKLGVPFQGKENWSKAVFLSPSVYYSANPVYSKQFIDHSGNSVWLPIVQAKLKKGTYEKYDHTLSSYTFKDTEPTSVQFRVECHQDQQEDAIIRSEETTNIHVIAIMFIKKGFLEKVSNFNEATNIVLNSKEQQKFRELHK